MLSYHMVGVCEKWNPTFCPSKYWSNLLFVKNDPIQVSTIARLVRGLYLNPILDMTITFCFLDVQTTNASARTTLYSPIELSSSGQEAQSAYVKLEIVRWFNGLMWMPKCEVPLRYLIILLTAHQWDIIGGTKKLT